MAVLLYLGLLVAGPVAMVFGRSLRARRGQAWHSVTTSAGLHAIYLTLLMAAIAVPLNTVVGIAAGLLLVRGPRWLQLPLGAVLDLPFAIPPVVIGLGLVLLYGRQGWFGTWLADHGDADPVLLAGHGHRDRDDLAALRGPRGGARAARGRRRAGGGGRDARGLAPADVLARHVPDDPLRPSPTASC